MTMNKNAPFALLENSPEDRLRFIKTAQAGELLELFRLARVALSGQECTRYTRMLWASKEFSKKYPNVSSTAAYKDLDTLLTQE